MRCSPAVPDPYTRDVKRPLRTPQNNDVSSV